MSLKEVLQRAGLFAPDPAPAPGAMVLLSDLHLDQLNPVKLDALGAILAGPCKQAGEVVLLGDLADGLHYAEGQKKLASKSGAFLKAMQEARGRGAAVTYIPGNHDAHFRERAMDWEAFAADCTGAERTQYRQWHGRRLRLTHGDEVDPFEQGGTFKPLYGVMDKLPWIHDVLHALYKAEHQFWMGLEPLSGALAELAPERHEELRFRMEVARTDPGFFVSVLWLYEKESERLIRDEDLDVVIMGHTHTPRLERKGRGVYLNTGDWLQHAVVSWLTPDGMYQQDLASEPEARFLSFHED